MRESGTILYMPMFQKIKDTVDWGRRIQFIVQVAGLLFSASAWTAAWHWIKEHPALLEWRRPISFLAASVALVLFAALSWLLQRPSKPAPPSEKRLDEVINKIKIEGAKWVLLGFYANRANGLLRDLESLWHHWNNVGEKLIHPLDATKDKIDFSRDDYFKLVNERRDFQTLYIDHVQTLKVELPDFSSWVIETGFPSEAEYQEVLGQLTEHVKKLEAESKAAWERY